MELFLYRLFFNNDPAPGVIRKLFGIEPICSDVDGASMLTGVTSEHPIWLLTLITFGFAILAYVLGSLNFSVLISKYVFHDDVRNYGSHNAGSTNMNRTYGTVAGVLTLVGDFAKGVAATLIPILLIGYNVGYLAGFCCILGHCFPIFFKFKGGKGAATSAGIIFAADPIVGAIIVLTFLVVTIGTKFVSLGSIISALIFPLVLDRIFLLTSGGIHPSIITVTSSLLMTIAVVFAHRQNIGRLLSGTESKISFKKKKGKTEQSVSAENESKDAKRSLHRIDDDESDESGEEK